MLFEITYYAKRVKWFFRHTANTADGVRKIRSMITLANPSTQREMVAWDVARHWQQSNSKVLKAKTKETVPCS